MCGIFGMVGRLEGAALDRVSAALFSRGPDAEGRHVEDGVSLLHRRLKIIDLSPAATQPMTNEDGSLWLVFNGEIYNHRALQNELVEAGHTFRSRSDTEVIVHGYEQWGDALVRKLDGMFSFGLWDGKRARLLLAVDRAGKKPLYYSESGGFRFASTVTALRASGLKAPPAVDTLPYYLAYGFVPPPLSLHQGVRQLPPASQLVVERGRAASVVTYWNPSFRERQHGETFSVASRRVRDLVTRAVERRVEADVPLGAFLSGGIDSTIVVGVAAKLFETRLRTFSIGFSGDPRFDETHYARIAARAFGTDHTEFTLEPASFDLVETLVDHHDGPFGDSSAVPTYIVSKLARQHVTVALTGDGGDEIFCGYARFLAAEAAEQIPLPIRQIGARLLSLLPGGTGEGSLVGKARRVLSASTLSLPDRLARWNSYFPESRAILRPDVAATMGYALDAPLEWQRATFALARGTATMGRILEHNFRTYLPFDLLVKADRCSMAHGLELRSPFLDTELVEYVSSLPAGYLRRGLLTKRILKHAFRDILPKAIRTRGKMGFGMPLGTWFRDDLKDYLHDHLGPGARIDEYLDRPAVTRLLEEHDERRADHGHRLWTLLTLEIWLRKLARSPSSPRSSERSAELALS